MIVYDKYDFDAMHVKNIMKAFPEASFNNITIPFGSHYIVMWLNSAGILKNLVVDYFSGKEILFNFTKLKQNVTHYESLSRVAFSKKKYCASKKFAYMALSKGSESHVLFKRLSNIYSKERNLSIATGYAVMAYENAPNDKFRANYLSHVIRVLLDNEELGLASEYLKYLKLYPIAIKEYNYLSKKINKAINEKSSN